MRLPVDQELRNICREIAAAGRSAKDWEAVESDDAFQTPRYCGGYEAVEHAFCFSLLEGSSELWFQLTLEEVEAVAAGSVAHIDVRPAEA